jgi:hypothetical protein
MSLKERTYSILVVSSTDSFASAFIGSLPEIRYYPVLTASSVSAAKRMLKEKSFDFVIILCLMISAFVLRSTFVPPDRSPFCF